VVEARAPVDVWADGALLAVLKGSGYPPGSSAAERDRLQHRARGYKWREDHLVRRLASGEARVVPRPAARGSLVKDVHVKAGHLGVKKTLSLLRPHYWWVGMAADVARALKGCKACDRVKATFNARHPTLQPLPIKGLFYRWGLDFAGPLPKTTAGQPVCVDNGGALQQDGGASAHSGQEAGNGRGGVHKGGADQVRSAS
jgi:hypothetical protein